MRKNLFITACLFFLSLCGISQSNLNLVIFSEDGDLFFAYINGIRQNDRAESNVKVTNLTSPNISLRIEFNDKAIPNLKQNMSLEMGYEHTAKIKRDTKKQLKLRYFGQTPIDNSPTPGMSTVQYHTVENTGSANEVAPTNNNNTITETTTSTQTYNGNNGNGSVNINMGGAGISMNVSGMDPNGTNMNSTTSTTVTNSSSSNYSSSNSNSDNNNSSYYSGPGKATCSTAMTAGDFSKMKQSVESKPFSDTKMSTAKVAAKNSCLSVNQVKEICKLFSMDDEKLAYAKFAYDYCIDKANFYQVSEIFSFSSTTEDLNKFLEHN